LPYTIVVPKGVVADETLVEPALARRGCVVVRHGVTDDRPSRSEVLEALLASAPPEAAIVSTTGWTSRELYTLDDREQHFYLVGAMGSAIAVGLGVSLHSPRPTIVVDGDGALLMRMGSLATVGAHGGANLVHLVLDNGVHDSTGGQRTLSSIVDVPAAAAACGYGQVHTCATGDDLSDALRSALAGQGPSLIYLPIRPGSLSNLGRPKVTPAEVARRFRSFVTSGDRIEVSVS
jgi:phosphonopyruvate decarboxylase